MPLAIRWSAFTKEKVRRESDNYGVYELGNYRDILYIGEGHVKTRLMSHFSHMPGVSSYRVEYSSGIYGWFPPLAKWSAKRRQNEELNSYHRKHGKLPRYNKRKG